MASGARLIAHNASGEGEGNRLPDGTASGVGGKCVATGLIRLCFFALLLA